MQRGRAPSGAARYHPRMAGPRWSTEAERRLKKVPFFIRPFVKRRAEAVARERGIAEVTSELLDEIKQREHRGS